MHLIEANLFNSLGGWSVDSGWLLAHGMGTLVEDAVATFRAKCGWYKLWVRTRDWSEGAGRFTVVVNGKESKEFGVGRSEWGWVDGGIVELKDGENEIRLHDLTGFDGRCDALLFVEAESDYRPDDAAPWEWRKKLLGLPEKPEEKQYDFVVIGGGYSGMCAAVAAARSGMKTALVQDRPVFGGNASSEVRVGPIGALGLPPYPGLGNLAYELMVVTRGKGQTSGGLRPLPDDDKIREWLESGQNLDLYPNCRCMSAKKDSDGRIVSIGIRNLRKCEELVLKANLFADCTGDAILAELAGATLRTSPEAGEPIKGGYGSTNFWTTRWTDHETTFPECPWALKINDDNWQVNRPKFFVEGDYPYAAGWNWESGFDKDPIKDAEWIRDYNLRAAYGMWDYLKNRSPEKAKYAKAEMDWLGHVLGRRAARRIEGDYVLTAKDLIDHVVYPDGVVTTTWFLDLHFPHPTNAKHFTEGAFRSMAYDDPMYDELCEPGVGRQIKIKPYPIPYRCFYSKDVPNLFMAGKDISTTHVAMSSVRVENTCAMMGALVGEAASLCHLRGWSPRELGAEHFEELKSRLENLRMSSLARHGRRIYQHRETVKGEIKHWLRPIVRPIKKLLGKH